MMQVPPQKVRVSDHAVLRYLERGVEFNIEMVRTHIAEICGMAAAVGATCVRAEGLRFEIVNGVVVTIKHDHLHPSQNSQARSREKIARGA